MSSDPRDDDSAVDSPLNRRPVPPAGPPASASAPRGTRGRSWTPAQPPPGRRRPPASAARAASAPPPVPAPSAKPPIEDQPTTTLPPVSGPIKQPVPTPGDRSKPADADAAQPTVALTKTPAAAKTPPGPGPVPPKPTAGPPKPTAGPPKPAAGPPKPAKPHPVPAPGERTLNKNAVPALLFSFFGITAPVGVYLGRKARQEIARTGETGDPYAVAALFIGWAYITAFGLGVASYLIFVIGGS